jgi:nitrate reductase gamma subunit
VTSLANYLDTVLFSVFPYVAMVLFLVGTIHRYRNETFTYSSLSSQLLENKQHFWAVVPFHYGIITVLTGHAVAFLVPRQLLLFNSRPLRLYILEVSALIFGVTTLVALFALIARRFTEPRVRVVLLKLSPNIAIISAMPLAVKLHIVNAWLVIAFFPFTRLVHILVVPNQYLFRKRQVVRWYRRPQLSRS